MLPVEDDELDEIFFLVSDDADVYGFGAEGSLACGFEDTIGC